MPETSKVLPFPKKNLEEGHRRVALIGNPNVGKSVLFGLLRGRYVSVSNYPGTTVEVARVETTLDGKKISIWDTPGVHLLIPMSEAEKVTRDILLSEGLITMGLTYAFGIIFPIVLTLFIPCLANLLMIVKERGARAAVTMVGLVYLISPLWFAAREYAGRTDRPRRHEETDDRSSA